MSIAVRVPILLVVAEVAAPTVAVVIENVYDRRSLSSAPDNSDKGLKSLDLNGDSNPDLCDAGAVLFN